MSSRYRLCRKSGSTPSSLSIPLRSGNPVRHAVSELKDAAVLPTVHDVLHSPGQALDPAARAFMELRFGHDFSQVRVHAGAKAASSAQAVAARAFTLGQQIVFGTGQYSPHSSEGRRLLAHELTHVVQQADSSRPTAASYGVAEQEARSNSQRVSAGIPAEVSSSMADGTLQRDDKAPGGTTEKESDVKTKREATIKLKVPIWSGGKFGALSLLEQANLKLKVAETESVLKPGDPAYQAQLETALTLARYRLFKLGLGSYGTLSGGLKATGTIGGEAGTSKGAKGSVGGALDVEALKYKSPTASGQGGELGGTVILGGSVKGTAPTEGEATGAVGAKLGGELKYKSPFLPYYPYGRTGPMQAGRLTLGAGGSLFTEYGTKGKAKYGAGVSLSAGYEWPKVRGVQPFMNVKFDVKWTQTGGKVESSQVTSLNLGLTW